MRIATSTIYEAGTAQLGTLQSQMAKTQMQLATNKRVVTAADDPIAASRALEVTQSQSINTQLATNRANARSSLSQVEVALSSTSNLLQDVQALAVAAGNGSLSDIDRASLATELEGHLNDLLGLANTADGTGGYLFSGYKANTRPFAQTATGADYQGDQGQRQLQVGSTRQMPITDSGSAIFENNLTGNGTFQTGPLKTNTGAGIVSAGSVTDPAKVTGHDYSLAFKVSGTPAVTTYSVTDNILKSAVAGMTDVPYQSGQQIAFDGMSFEVKGAPADGDSFSVKPSQKQSVFTTITDMLATLRQGAASPAGRAALSNGLTQAGMNLKSALDNVLTARSSIGSRQKELDNLDSTGEDMNAQYTATLSDLQDLDMVKAISMFSQQQVTLEAAQKSFKTMSGLSLFNYIG